MRAMIYRLMCNPWFARITCLVIFVVLMGGAKFGLYWLKHNTSDTTVILICGVIITLGLMYARWFDRRAGL